MLTFYSKLVVRAVVHLCVDVRMPTKASEGEEKETKGKSIILRLAAYASTRVSFTKEINHHDMMGIKKKKRFSPRQRLKCTSSS